MDWLLVLGGSSLAGLTASTYAFVRGLPIELSGIIAFTCTALLWMAWQIKRRVEAENVGPVEGSLQPPVDPSRGYLTPYETIAYLADESQWGSQKATELTPDGLHKHVRLEALGEFSKRGAEGKVRVYGFSPTTHEHVLIDKTHWMSYQFETPDVFDQSADVRTTASSFSSSFYGKPGFSELKIDADDVYRTWQRHAALSKEVGEEFISLREAANIAYEQLRLAGSNYAAASEILGYASEGETRAEAILTWFSYLIAPKIAVYGKRSPSRIRERVNQDEFKRGGFENGGNTFRYHYDKEPLYVELEVRRSDLDNLIKQLKG